MDFLINFKSKSKFFIICFKYFINMLTINFYKNNLLILLQKVKIFTSLFMLLNLKFGIFKLLNNKFN